MHFFGRFTLNIFLNFAPSKLSHRTLNRRFGFSERSNAGQRLGRVHQLNPERNHRIEPPIKTVLKTSVANGQSTVRFYKLDEAPQVCPDPDDENIHQSIRFEHGGSRESNSSPVQQNEYFVHETVER